MIRLRTLEEIRKTNKIKEHDLLFSGMDNSLTLTQEEYDIGRKEYEEWIKPTIHRVFERMNENKKDM
jgi:hypothetical protein